MLHLWYYLPLLFCLHHTHAAPSEVPTAASFYVPHLPDLHQDNEHPLHIYAGPILTDPHAAAKGNADDLAHLFFVMIKARRMSDKERLMFWFNGGPGCSSFDGLMMENGPWRVDENGGLTTIEGGWEEYTTMVYIDQPTGTGLSYGSTEHYIHSLSEASEHFLRFLHTFYNIFPEYLTVDTYLAGESFAGQYIPYFATAILSSNIGVPLKGIAIGNGWIDGRHQYPAYLDYALKYGLVEENTEEYKQSKQLTDACIAELSRTPSPDPIHVQVCKGLSSNIPAINQKMSDDNLICMNPYDIRLRDTYPSCHNNWPPAIRNVTSYLTRKDVLHALHASAKHSNWVECNHDVSHALLKDQISPSSINILPKLLEKIPVLLFAGDMDFICNYMGIESMIRSMTWNGVTGFGLVQSQPWSVEDTSVGTWISSRNLTYAKVFNASHMVPYDFPTVAHDMILRFMGMNFSAILDGSARIPSTVGTDAKPVFNPAPAQTVLGKTLEQNQAMVEAYHNAGSIALIVAMLASSLALCLWCGLRRRRGQHPKKKTANIIADETTIPLNAEEYDIEFGSPVFDVGEDDEAEKDR